MPRVEGMSTLTFQNIVDDGALLFLETHHFQDDRFEEWGYQRWNTEDSLASLNLHFAERTMTVNDTVFLGTAGPGPKTFLWAWANPGVSPTPAQQAVFEQIANFGGHYGIPELTEPEIPFTTLVPAYADEEVMLNGAKGGATLCGFKIAVAARMISGMSNHFIADAGSGSTAVALYQHPELGLGRASALTFQFRLMEAMTGGLITDHRRAVESYARLRLSTLPSEIQPNTLELRFDDGVIKVEFDENNRLSNLKASLGGQQ
jgi:hypothetical protein